MIVYVFIIFLVTLIASSADTVQDAKILAIKAGDAVKVRLSCRFDTCFWAVFVVLAFFSAIRDGIGIDYYEYFRHIEIIRDHLPDYMEKGFKGVVLFLGQIDENPRFTVIVFGVLTVWLYVRAIWEQSECRRDSIFIFLSWGYYFLTFNTIRNYFALALVFYAIRFLKKDRKLLFLIFVLLAASFHKTALVCIPIYYLATFKLKKEHYLALTFLTAAAFVGKNYIRRIVFFFYPHFENGVYDTGRVSYFNIIKAVAVIMLCLLYGKRIIKDHAMTRLFFQLNVFSLFFYVGMYWTPEISRIGFYMNATSIFLVPNVIQSIHSFEQRKIVRAIVYGGSMCMFLLLCREFYVPTTKLLPYETWLFHGGY